MASGMSKICPKCSIEKDLSEFRLNNSKYYYVCKSCDNARVKAWKKNHKERVSGYNRKQSAKDTPERKARRLAHDRRRTEELSDGYIIKNLKRGKFKDLVIPKELIDLKRVHIQLNRELNGSRTTTQ